MFAIVLAFAVQGFPVFAIDKTFEVRPEPRALMATQDSTKSLAQAGVLQDVLESIEEGFVDNLNMAQVQRAAARAAAEATGDPYTSLARISSLDAASAVDFSEEDGKKWGLGMAVVSDSRDKTFLTITAVYDASPAWQGGARVGDRITAVAGQTVPALGSQPLSALARAISITGRGEQLQGVGSLRLEVERDGVGRLSLDLQPAPGSQRPALATALSLPAAWWPRDRLLDPLAYLKIVDLGPSSSLQVKEGLRNLLAARTAATQSLSLILDLRDNPGGLLSEGIKVAELLLPPRTLVATLCSRSLAGAGLPTGGPEAVCPAGMTGLPLRTSEEGPLIPEGTRIAVLVNSGTRSAAEVLAAALQDWDAGLVVGHASFGKASAQRLVPVGQDGDVLRLTTARLLTPSGRSIQRLPPSLSPPTASTSWHTAAGRPVVSERGVEPDVEVDSAETIALSRGGGPGGDSTAVDTLIRTGALFDLAGDWAARHPTLVRQFAGPSPGVGPGGEKADWGPLVGALGEGLADEVEAWAAVHRFSQDSGPDAARDGRLADLAQDLRRQGRQGAAAVVEAAQGAEWADLRRDLHAHRQAAAQRAREAILARFMPVGTRLQALAAWDPLIEAASVVLQPEAYSAALALRPGSSTNQATSPTTLAAPEGNKGLEVLQEKEQEACLMGQVTPSRNA